MSTPTTTTTVLIMRYSGYYTSSNQHNTILSYTSIIYKNIDVSIYDTKIISSFNTHSIGIIVNGRCSHDDNDYNGFDKLLDFHVDYRIVVVLCALIQSRNAVPDLKRRVSAAYRGHRIPSH